MSSTPEITLPDARAEGPKARKERVRKAMKRFLGNALLLALSMSLVVALGEAVLRHRYGHMLYRPRTEVAAIQQYLTLNDSIGFTWKPDIDFGKHIVLANSDTELDPLSTDEFGFWNHPEAIAARRSGQPVDVIGLGDSFMEGAAFSFYTMFREHGLSYYSMSIHRQCPAQYYTILNDYALINKPKWIVLGLFENDFSEITDYDDWRRSDLDWFAYHSGTWCGPPIGVDWKERFVKTYLKGWNAFYRVLYAKVRGERMTVGGPTAYELGRVQESVLQAVVSARANGAQLVVVLIPSKQSTLHGATKEAEGYDEVMLNLREYLIPTVDLRPVFRNHANPASLYYEKDGHWNREGVRIAGEEILKRLEAPPT
ncbi:MAG: hypothetical protein K1Y02_08855 [Candidatus Hydrogenedentes bacterium]|nr:hypothetical protein [Candidatus Hydrogenedentota bacterium]